MALFVNTGEGHLDSSLIILLRSELVTVFTVDNFESMIITPCVKDPAFSYALFSLHYIKVFLNPTKL